MPLIFTDDYIATFRAEPAPFEGSLIKRIALSKEGRLAGRRDDLEAKVAAYPEPQRSELIGRIQSFADDESLAAQAELDVHELLRREFKSVEVEPVLEIVGGKTPDFWVDGHAAFEVASTFAHSSAVELDLIKALNSVPSPVKIFGLRTRNVPEDKYPRISDARNRVREAMVAYSGEPALNPFHVRTRDGMDVTGYLYSGDPAHPTIGGTIESHGFGPDDPNYRQGVRKNVIQVKYRKYKKLAEHGYPLILVFQNHNAWLDAEDFDQVLFGDVEYRYEGKADQYTLVRREVVFGPGHYRGISAALLHDPADPGRYYLAKNPYATVPIDALEARITKCFEGKSLPKPDWELRARDKGA